MKSMWGRLTHVLQTLWTELCLNGWRTELYLFPDDPATPDDTQLRRAPSQPAPRRTTSR